MSLVGPVEPSPRAPEDHLMSYVHRGSSPFNVVSRLECRCGWVGRWRQADHLAGLAWDREDATHRWQAKRAAERRPATRLTAYREERTP